LAGVVGASAAPVAAEEPGDDVIAFLYLPALPGPGAESPSATPPVPTPTPTPFQLPLERVASAMSPGTWAELDTLHIDEVLAASGSSGSLFGYSEALKWDSSSQQLFYLGGDHGDDPRFVSYSALTNEWRIRPSQPWMSATSHGYDHSAIDASSGRFFHRPFNSRVVHQYDIAADAWSELKPVPESVMDYNNCCVGVEWFPDLGSLLWASHGSLFAWRDADRLWSEAAAGLPMGTYHHFAEYNPIHDVVVFGGGNGSRDLHVVDAEGRVATLRPAPFDLGVQWGAVFTVDPVGGDYLVLARSGEFFSYDVVTDAWTLISESVPVTTTQFDNPIHGVVATPVDTYGVTLFVTCDGRPNCRVTLWKHPRP
jgi:hypothetical protein